MSENVKQNSSIYSATEQSFFGGRRILVSIVTLFCSGVLFAQSGFKMSVRLSAFVPQYAFVPSALGICIMVWLVLPSAFLLFIRTNIKGNKISKIHSLESMLKTYLLLLTVFAVFTFIMLLMSGSMAQSAVNWLLSQDDVMQRLETLMPRINTFLVANEFKTFESMRELLENTDALLGIDLGIKAVFAILTLLNALTSSLLKHAILSCAAIRSVVEQTDAPDEIPHKVSLFLVIAAAAALLFAVILGTLLASPVLALALVLLAMGQITTATALKRYRDERLLMILNNKKKRA